MVAGKVFGVGPIKMSQGNRKRKNDVSLGIWERKVYGGA